MISRRTSHGIEWGMVSAGIVAVIPLLNLAGGWPVPGPVTPSFFGRVLGVNPLSVPAVLLAVLWQLIYGGFWGGFLAYVSGPFRPGEQPLVRASPIAYGVGVGFYRTLVAGLTVLLYLRWGAFGALVSPLVILNIFVSDLAFGLTLGWLLAREDAGRLTFAVPRLFPLGRFGARRRS
jgi:hypothetical protein